MTLRVSTHVNKGGMFLLNMATRKVLEVIIPPDPTTGWNENTTADYLRYASFTNRDFNGSYFVPHPNAFEFKGKHFIKLGQHEGLTKIRNVQNMNGDSRDNPMFLGGEEQEEAA